MSKCLYCYKELDTLHEKDYHPKCIKAFYGTEYAPILPYQLSEMAKVAVQCSADSFVVNQSLVLRINICGENRDLRQARNR